MKQIFTLVTMGMLCLASNNVSAQINEQFSNGITPLTNNCWVITNATTTATNKGLSGSGSSLAFTNNGISTLQTPYVSITTGSVNINFDYATSSNVVQAGKTRTIQVGYQDKSGNFTPLSSIINVASKSKTAFQVSGSNTFTVPNGTYRIVVKGYADGVDDVVMIDNFIISGSSFYYGTSSCNTAPIAVNDKYSPSVIAPLSGNVLNSPSGVDSDPNSGSPYFETISVTGFTQTIETGAGVVTLNTATGDFTFTPAASFAGGPVNFNYTITDNGYDPLSSTGTVTITYPNAIITPLPIHILSFQGALNKDKAQLAWSVADNETGSYFEVQKSSDGKNFENASTMFTTDKVGNENYNYTDANTNTAGAFYRLKVYNKDNSTSFSKVVYLKTIDATANKIVLLQNPVQNTLSFSFTANSSEASEINVYNMVGVKMFSQKLTAQKGTNTITTDCNNKLSTGNYILQISSASGSATTKFIKK